MIIWRHGDQMTCQVDQLLILAESVRCKEDIVETGSIYLTLKTKKKLQNGRP